MRIKKILSVVLAAFMLFVLYGCGTPEVKFVAKIFEEVGHDPIYGDIELFKSEFPESVSRGPDLIKQKELKNKTETILVGKEKVTATYSMTVKYPDGGEVYEYVCEAYHIGINQKGDLVELTIQDDADWDETYETTEERKEGIKKIALEYFGLDLSNTQYTETETSGYQGKFAYKLNGKNTGHYFTVNFDENLKVSSIFCQSGIYPEEIEKYPDFDRNECYEAAKARLLKDLDQSTATYYYASDADFEEYQQIDGNLYYKFLFRLSRNSKLTANTEYTGDMEKFLQNADNRIIILVELITE